MPQWYTEWHLWWIELFQDPLIFWPVCILVITLTLLLRIWRKKTNGLR